ncbi:MAG: putative toxin-antitoxin system toxin component, PIN family [Alloprevotella sp.]|nr:putative toxin-antitoxin system toxin component, PIN family [Alloprevotella sp.]
MRLVLDTNCLIQSIPPKSRYHSVWQAFVNETNTLCVSNEILNEYEEILQRLAGHEVAELVLKTIINGPFTELVTPFYRFHLIETDPDDNKFVDCAIAANARYVVTHNHHYDVLRKISFPHVEIITLENLQKDFGLN